jgi:hypothetical protein
VSTAPPFGLDDAAAARQLDTLLDPQKAEALTLFGAATRFIRIETDTVVAQ